MNFNLVIYHQFNKQVMQTKQQLAQSIFIKELFIKKDYTASNYLDILLKHEKVKFCTADQFLQYIKHYVTEEQFMKFLLLFTQQHRSFQIDDDSSCYPIVINDDKQFEAKKLLRFIAQYLKQEDSKLGEFKINDLSQGPFTYEPQLQKQSGQNINSQQPCIEQPKQIKNKVPSFLLQRTRSLNFLLQLNLSRFFSHQFNEVKSLIWSQIDSNGMVFHTYKQFLRDFLQVHFLKEGECQDNLGKQRQLYKQDIAQYFKYLDKYSQKMTNQNIKSSHLNYCWKSINSKLQQKMSTIKEKIRYEVKSIINEAINHIFLTFGFSCSTHRSYWSQSIFINTNQITNNLTLRQFREGPLKPYIALMIYHEITHWLLRDNSFCQISDQIGFFSSQSPSIGRLIIQFIKYQYKRVVPTYLHVAPKGSKQIVRKHSILPIEQIVDTAQKILRQHKDIFYAINTIHLSQLKGKLDIFYIFASVAQNIKIKQYKKYWHSVYKYIDQLLEQKQPSQPLQKKQQIKYQLFFSFFLTEHIAKFWLNQMNEKPQLYQQYRQKLCKNRVQRYYIKSNQLIDKLMYQQIIRPNKFQDYFSNTQVDLYIKSILVQDSPFQRLKQRIENIAQIYSKTSQQINSLTLQMSYSFFFKFKRYFNGLDISYSLVKMNPDYLPSILKDVLQQIQKLDFVQQYYQILNNTIIYSDILHMVSELPDFITRENPLRPGLDSGFQIEQRLFGKKIIEKIYSKDYKLIQNIDDQKNQFQIGTAPQKLKDKLSSIIVSKEKIERDIGIDLKDVFCGNYLSNKAFEERKAKKKL